MASQRKVFGEFQIPHQENSDNEIYSTDMLIDVTGPKKKKKKCLYRCVASSWQRAKSTFHSSFHRLPHLSLCLFKKQHFFLMVQSKVDYIQKWNKGNGFGEKKATWALVLRRKMLPQGIRCSRVVVVCDGSQFQIWGKKNIYI